jgi:YD repeat-containing protein
LTVATVEAALTPDSLRDRITKNTPDAAGRRVQSIDGLGHSEFWTYDPFNQCVAHQDKTGYIWHTIFDNAGRKVQQQTPTTTLVTVQNDPNHPGKLISTSSQAAIITEQQYDNNNNIIAVINAKGDLQARTIRFQYNAVNAVTNTILDNVDLDDPTQTPTSKTRPEKTATLMTQTIYDAFRQPVAYQDEAGKWSFKVYDAEGHLCYEVDARQYVTGYQYNAFDQVIALTRYANLLSINPVNFAKTGLTLADIITKLTPNPTQDRILTTQYNQLGQKIQVQQAAVWTYLPSNDQTPGQLIKAQPTQQWAYNAFGDTIILGMMLRANRWLKPMLWVTLLSISATVMAKC